MKQSGLVKFFLFLVFIAGFVVAGQYLDLDPEKSRAFFDQYPIVLSSFIFVFLYVVGTFFIWVGPKDVLRVASLFVFGVMWSTVLTYIGEMLNMCTMFWFSRRLGRPFVEQKMKGKIKDMDETMSQTSTPMIFFLKFYPVIPFRFLDLAYGLTKISFSRYAIITLIAAPIRLYVIQYFLDIMIRFGVMAAKGNMQLLIERFFLVTDYLTDHSLLLWSLTAYTFSAIIFFFVLLSRRKTRVHSQD